MNLDLLIRENNRKSPCNFDLCDTRRISDHCTADFDLPVKRREVTFDSAVPGRVSVLILYLLSIRRRESDFSPLKP